MSGVLALTPSRPSPYPQGQTESGHIIPVNALVWEVTGHIRGSTQKRSQKSYCPVAPLSKALKGPLWGFFRSRAFSGDLRASGLCKSLCFLPPTSYSDRQDPDSWLCLGNQFLETDLGKRSGEMWLRADWEQHPSGAYPGGCMHEIRDYRWCFLFPLTPLTHTSPTLWNPGPHIAACFSPVVRPST